MSNRIFEPRLYQDVHAISKLVLERAKVDRAEDLIRNQVLMRIETEILTERIAEETLHIEEEPTYTSPQTTFLSTLPTGSFRQRFLAHWWDIDLREPLSKRVVHEVTVRRWVNLPEHGVPQQSIEETMRFWA